MTLADDYLPPLYDCVIVGAGLTGLVAAYEIYKRCSSLNVIILESSQWIGGQILTSDIGELGARWISANESHILKLCNELKIELELSARWFSANESYISKLNNERKIAVSNIEQLSEIWESCDECKAGLRKFAEGGRCTMEDHHQYQIIQYKSKWTIDRGFWSFLAKFELERFLSMIDVICEDRDLCSSSYTDSMENFICEHLFFESGRNLVRLLVISVCGVEAKLVKVVNFMSICSSWMGISKLLNRIRYEDMINWRKVEITEPPLLSLISESELRQIAITGELPTTLKLPCHTQSVERSVQLVTQASLKTAGMINRDGFIRCTLYSRSKMPKYNTKSQYVRHT